MARQALHVRVFQPSDHQHVQQLFLNESKEMTRRLARTFFLSWSTMSLLCAGVVGILSMGTAHSQGKESPNKYGIFSAAISGIILWSTSIYLTCHWLTGRKVKEYMQNSRNQDLLDIAKFYNLKAGHNSTYEPEGKSNFWVCTAGQESPSIVGAIGFRYNPSSDEGQVHRLGISPSYKYAINDLIHTVVNWAKQNDVRSIVIGSKQTKSSLDDGGLAGFEDLDSVRHLIYLELISQYRKS
ncbi:hypothetical protein INT43_001819 [Umbelopsis isabellina]|uniref:Uncharacterized protein n=1 Tax=Mortierella isabellina TaxID=91625 RepID=A0A8H7UES9_MORIS|nr:hypothetical protein INT43_001819 [Umbelopsis isabellina]